MGSTHRVFGPSHILTDGVMSATNVLHSTAIDCASYSYASFQCTWTGTPVGSFKVEASIDGTHYYDLELDLDNPSGGSGDTLIPLEIALAFKWLRLTYTNSSGSGVLNVYGFARDAG